MLSSGLICLQNDLSWTAVYHFSFLISFTVAVICHLKATVCFVWISFVLIDFFFSKLIIFAFEVRAWWGIYPLWCHRCTLRNKYEGQRPYSFFLPRCVTLLHRQSYILEEAYDNSINRCLWLKRQLHFKLYLT